MDEERLKRLIARFAAAAEAHGAALEAMDEERASRHAHIIYRLYQEIAGAGEQGREELILLAERAEGDAAGMAAVYSLRYREGRSIAVLRCLAATSGLLAFRASVALERWERGEWDLE